MTDTPDTTTDNLLPENELARRRAAVDNTVSAVMAIRELARVYAAFEALAIPTSVWLPKVIASLPEPYNTRFGPGSERSGAVLVDLIATFTKGGTPAMMEQLPDLIGRILGNPEGKPSMFAALGARLGMAAAGLGSPAPQIGDEPPGDLERDELAEVDAGITAARMRIRIEKLFDEAPKMTLPDGTPDPSQAPALECVVVLRGSVPPIEGCLSTTAEGGLRFLSPTTDKNNKRVMLEQFFDYADVVAVCVQREVKAERKSTIIGAS